MRSDPQDHESTEFCKVHGIDYWPSEGCPECPHYRAEEVLEKQWWEHVDADEQYVEEQCNGIA